MDRNKIKDSVLQELIDLMESKEVEGLKSKSPKFMKVETNDPEMAKSVVKKAMEPEMEDKFEDPSKELSSSAFKEDMTEGENPLNEMDHKSDEDPEDLKRLLEMYHKLK